MIKTYSVLEKLQAAVDKHQGRVKRANVRIEALREEYRVAHWSKRRDLEKKGFRAKQTLARAETDLLLAKSALNAEERRLSQPDSFLKFA